MQIRTFRTTSYSTGLLKLFLLLLSGLNSFSLPAEASPDLEGTVFEQVGHEANIDPLLLYAIALCESAYHPNPSKGMVAPYPWVIRTPEGPVYGDGKASTERSLFQTLKRTKSVDVGLMQINLKWNGHRVENPAELLDPVTNVRVAAQILNELFARHPDDAVKAIGFYHSRSLKRAEGYGRTVWRVYNSLKAF